MSATLEQIKTASEALKAANGNRELAARDLGIKGWDHQESLHEALDKAQETAASAPPTAKTFFESIALPLIKRLNVPVAHQGND